MPAISRTESHASGLIGDMSIMNQSGYCRDYRKIVECPTGTMVEPEKDPRGRVIAVRGDTHLPPVGPSHANGLIGDFQSIQLHCSVTESVGDHCKIVE